MSGKQHNISNWKKNLATQHIPEYLVAILSLACYHQQVSSIELNREAYQPKFQIKLHILVSSETINGISS
jgi:hypothetical protein